MEFLLKTFNWLIEECYRIPLILAGVNAFRYIMWSRLFSYANNYEPTAKVADWVARIDDGYLWHVFMGIEYITTDLFMKKFRLKHEGFFLEIVVSAISGTMLWFYAVIISWIFQ